MVYRIDKLIDAWDPILQKAFLESIYAMRDQAQISHIIEMLEKNDIEGALRGVGLDPTALRAFDKAILDAFEAGGNATSTTLPTVKLEDGYRIKFQFNIRNPAAERWMNDNAATLAREIIDDQRTMVRNFLKAGLEEGDNPTTTALDLVGRIGASGKRENGVIGLTASQEDWVRNYRDALESDSLTDALSYSLRDARFDATVRKADDLGVPLSSDDITRMVNAYKNRALRYRAESISRTEAIAALHESQQQAVEQALTSGAIDPSAVKFIWRATKDKRTRDSHREMDGQEVSYGEKFTTPDGAELEFPGDPNGPPEEIINCRCWRETKVDFLQGIE